MKKMSKTQRTAVLDFHNGVNAKGNTMLADSRTIAVLVREGWAVLPPHVTAAVARVGKVRVAYVTRAGLIAAGVDMDAIHAEALAEHINRMGLLEALDILHAEAPYGSAEAAARRRLATARGYVRFDRNLLTP